MIQNPNLLIKKGLTLNYIILFLSFISIFSGYFMLELVDLFFQYESTIFDLLNPVKILLLLGILLVIFIASLFIFFQTVNLYEDFSFCKISGGLFLLLAGISLALFSFFFPLLNIITFLFALTSLFQLRKELHQ